MRGNDGLVLVVVTQTEDTIFTQRFIIRSSDVGPSNCVMISKGMGVTSVLTPTHDLFEAVGMHVPESLIETFDPTRPGIVRLHRHPLLLALALWATAHVVPNGDLAHVLLFGSFAGFAVLGPRLIDRRKRCEISRDWDILAAKVKAAAPLPLPLPRLATGLALYLLLIAAHPMLFGVSPLP